MSNTSRLAWEDDDTYWRTNYRARPYAKESGQDYEYYRPGYRYGYDAANRFPEHEWSELESDLAKGWHTHDTKQTSTWEQIKDAVKDGWDRVMGRHSVSTR